MAAPSIIAGHYTATWNGVDIGTTTDGFRLQETHHHENIMVDDFGDVPIDGINRGTESRITLEFVEYARVIDAINAQIGAITDQGTTNTQVGQTLVSLAQQLVLTAVVGTPADSFVKSIKTLTAVKAIIVTDFEIVMAARHRKGPLTFQLFPDPTSGKSYTLTHGTTALPA